MQGHKEACKILLDAGADPNIISKNLPPSFKTTGGALPSTALLASIKKEYSDITNLLINHGAEISVDSVTAAAEKGDLLLLNKMVKEGGSINEIGTTPFLASPLCVASQKGNLNVVKFFIESGVEVNKICYRQTALGKAIKGSHYKVVKYLLMHHADPNIVLDSVDNTPFYLAAVNNPEPENYSDSANIIELLLEYDANKFHKAYYGLFTALSTVQEHIEVLQNRFESTGDNKKLNQYYKKHLEYKTSIVKILSAPIISK